MKVIGEQIVWQTDEKSELRIYQESAQQRSTLSHYTTFEVLRKIFSDGTLKFNRIDHVNDVLESKQFGEDELSHLVYISCFTHEVRESIPMWHIYGKNNQAVRITFELHTTDFSQNFINNQMDIVNPTDTAIIMRGKKNSPCVDWYCAVDIKDVLYCFNAIQRNPIRRPCNEMNCANKELYDVTAMGAIKREEWEYEKETRLFAYLTNTVMQADVNRDIRQELEIPDIDYLLIPISFEKIKNVTITFNPWMDSVTKTDIKLYMKSIGKSVLKNINIQCKDSILTNEVAK